MNDIRLLMIITPREFESAYEDFLKADGIAAIFSTPCQGTAGKSILDLLGLAQSEKVLIAAMMTKPHAAKLMRGMIYKLGINMPGNGIALTLPISSIGGASCMKYLMENQNIIIGGGSDMDDRQPVFPFDLLVAITERGHVELVMDAARTAGVPQYIVGIVYATMVQAYASEQSARMNAMDSANRNGQQMLDDYARELNAARQSAVTSEIAEIIGALDVIGAQDGGHK